MPPPDLDSLRQLLTDPQADPLEVGLVLGALSEDDIGRLGHGSLKGLLEAVLTRGQKPDYSTVMRWVRAASVLDGPDDPRRAWGPAKLGELARLASSEGLAPFLADHAPSQMSVRELRDAIRRRGTPGRAQADADGPHRVLERAIGIAFERWHPGEVQAPLRVQRGKSGDTLSVSGDLADPAITKTLDTASRITSAIATAKAAWRPVRRAHPVTAPPSMPLDDILALPPGQLGAEWVTPDLIRITKADQPILYLPVARIRRTNHEPVWAAGNAKTAGVFGIIDTISQGCVRVATGWPGTDVACFAMSGDTDTSCYANWTRWARQQRSGHGHFDVADNGLTNDLMKVRIPRDGDPSLTRHDQDHWRVDAESTDGALSIALGIFQTWSEANPDHRLFTLCSHAVRPSDEMLCWLGALRNCWTGHTISGWLSDEEFEVRLGAIRRFQGFGVRCVIWIVTHRTWNNTAVLKRALELVPPERITEAPYRYGTEGQDLPLLGINPLGSCSDHRVSIDPGGLEESYHVSWISDPQTSARTARLLDEVGHTPTLQTHSKCRNCRLMCGLNALDIARPPKCPPK